LIPRFKPSEIVHAILNGATKGRGKQVSVHKPARLFPALVNGRRLLLRSDDADKPEAQETALETGR